MDLVIRKPRIVAFEVTQRCKMNCVHCRASASAGLEDDLTTAQCEKIIKSLADYNRCVLIFTGGEPFERSDIFDLIDYAHSLGLAVSLATSGYNFDFQTAQRLKKSGVLTLSFSLDSDNAASHDDFRRTAGAFDKTLAAINIAKSAGLKFQINTTVTKLNFEKLIAIARLSETLGAYCFNPFMLVPAGRGKGLDSIALSPKEYEETLNTVAKLKANSKIEVRFTCAPRFAVIYSLAVAGTATKKKAFLPPVASAKVGGCLAASDFAFISHTGDIQTCGFLPISAGNILQTGSFASIWENSDFLNSIRQKNFIGKCGTCNFVQICGGCRARAFAQTGDYLASDPLCSYSSSLQQSHENSVSPHHGVYPVRCETISSGAGFRAANVSERSSSNTTLIAAHGGVSHCERSEAISTLIAAHVEPDKIPEVADAVNALPNVSHNYLRKHYYNLWFTLKVGYSREPSCHSRESGNPFHSIEQILDNLSQRFNTPFFSFPSTKRYKLDSSAIKRHNPPDNSNALFCCRITPVIASLPLRGERSNLNRNDNFRSAAKFLCSLSQVSHCIERKTGPNWPYNLYAVFHEKDLKRIEKIIADFVKEFNVDQFQILPTVKSLK